MAELVEAQREYDAAVRELGLVRRAKSVGGAAELVLDPSDRVLTECRLALAAAAAKLVGSVNALTDAQAAFETALAALRAARVLAQNDERLTTAVVALARTETAVRASRERLANAGRMLRQSRDRTG